MKSPSNRGFTLIEVIVVATCTAAVFLTIFISIPKHKGKQALKRQEESRFLESCVADRGEIKRYECQYMWRVMQELGASKRSSSDPDIKIDPSTGGLTF